MEAMDQEAYKQAFEKSQNKGDLQLTKEVTDWLLDVTFTVTLITSYQSSSSTFVDSPVVVYNINRCTLFPPTLVSS